MGAFTIRHPYQPGQRILHGVRRYLQRGRPTVQFCKANDSDALGYSEPDTAREAIDLGLVLCKQNK